MQFTGQEPRSTRFEHLHSLRLCRGATFDPFCLHPLRVQSISALGTCQPEADAKITLTDESASLRKYAASKRSTLLDMVRGARPLGLAKLVPSCSCR